MSELKITYNSLENAILKDGQFVSGYVNTIGGSIDASGYGAHAEGCALIRIIDASGNGAHAEGIDTWALADGAHAEGIYTNASGAASHAEGSYTIVSASSAHAEGFKTRALADGAHAEGYAFYGDGIISAGTIDASGVGAHAGGYAHSGGNINALGYGSFAHGYAHNGGTISSSGEGAYAEGYVDSSNAIIASGNGAHAEGIITLALASGSHAEGYNTRTTTLALCAHAEGHGTIASGMASHAGGIGTIANQKAMTAIGKYNVSTKTANTLFAVGDGTSSADAGRSDAFRVNSLGSEPGNNSVPSSVQAKVNGVPDVYLGCPIGTIVMWAGGGGGDAWDASTDAPDGWLICDGRVIPTDDYKHVSSGYEDFLNLLNVIGTKYGSYYADQYVASGIKTVRNIQIGSPAHSPLVCIPDFTQHFPLGAGYSTSKIEMVGMNLFDIIAGNETYSSYDGSTGGEASHTLTIDEMPTHTHYLATDLNNNGLNPSMHGETKVNDLPGPAGHNPWVVAMSGDDDSSNNRTYVKNLRYYANNATYLDSSDQYYIKNTGGSESHNNIPPFLAINFIIKYK